MRNYFKNLTIKKPATFIILLVIQNICSLDRVHAQQPTPEELANLQIKRQEKDTSISKAFLVIDGKFTGFNEAEGIKVTSSASILDYELEISSLEKDVNDLEIRVSSFIPPDGFIIEPKLTIDGKPINLKHSIKALESKKICITMPLNTSGDYKGTITLVYNKKLWPIPIKITRTFLPPSITIPEIQPIRTIGGKDVSFRVRIIENAGRLIRLITPSLSSLTLVMPDKNKILVDYDSLIVLNEKKDTLKELVIKPGEIRSLIMIIKNLQQSGEINGNLFISGTNISSQEKSFTIYKKDSGLIAFLFIALGILVTYFLRLYVNTIRPKLSRQYQVDQIIVKIDKIVKNIDDFTADEQKVVQAIQMRLSDALGTAQNEITDAESRVIFDEIDRKLNILPNWLSGSRAVDKLQPLSLQLQFNSKLKTVETTLLKIKLNENDFTVSEDILDKLSEEINIESKSELSEELLTFMENLNKARNESKLIKIHNSLTNEVEPIIKNAQSLLQLSKENNSNFINALNSFNKAKLLFTLILVDQLVLNLPLKPPIGFDRESWSSLKSTITKEAEEVKKISDANKADEKYKTMYMNYLRNLTFKLRYFLDRKMFELQNNAPTSLVNTSDIIKEIKIFTDKIDSILVKIDDSKLSEASIDYENITQEVSVFINKTQPIQPLPPLQTLRSRSAFEYFRSFTNSTISVDDLANLGNTSDSLSTISIPEPFNIPMLNFSFGIKKQKNYDPNKYGMLIKKYDLIYTAFILLISTIIGLKLIWVDSATWGNSNDYLVAIIWGLGFSQISNATYDGITGIASKLAK